MAGDTRVNGRFRMFDSALEMKDAGLVAASAAATVATVAKIIDVGDNIEISGDMVIDITAIEIASNDELYSIALQGSDVFDFTTGTEVIEELVVLNTGALEVLSGNADTTVGRYIIPFTNRRGDILYRYLRVYTTVAGTIATGINFTAFLATK